MAQWWEHLPPTNVAPVQIPASTPYVGWVCCWFSPLFQEVFLRVLRFSPLLKNQHFQIPIWPGIMWTKNHYVDVLPANRYLFVYLFIYFIWLVDCWLVNCLHDPSFFRWNLLPRSLCAGHRQRKANRNYGCLTPGSRPKLWIKPAMRSTWIGRGGIPLKNNLNTISRVLKDVGQFFSTCIFVSLIC